MPFSSKIVALAITLLSTGFPAAGGKPTALVTNLEAGREQVVVAYGTSLTSDGAWVEQLGGAIDKDYPGLVTVINSGGSGQWSKWGVESLDEEVIQKNPDVVFIEFSINDSVERFDVSVETARGNLEIMIANLREYNSECEIILMTMTPATKYPEGHQSHRKNITAHYGMYRLVAEQKELILVDHYPNWKHLQTTDEELFHLYVPDTIHATDAGCEQVITPVILDALGISGEMRTPVPTATDVPTAHPRTTSPSDSSSFAPAPQCRSSQWWNLGFLSCSLQEAVRALFELVLRIRTLLTQ